MFGLGGILKKSPDEFGKLQQSYNYLRKQHETVLEKLNKGEAYIEKIRSDYKGKIEELTKKLNELVQENERSNEIVYEQKEELRNLHHEHERSVSSNVALMNDKARLEEDNRKFRRDLSNSVEENRRVTLELEENTQLLGQLNDTCNSLTIEVEYLRLKTQGFDFYKVERIAKVFKPTLCYLIMRKNVNGEPIIEFENPSEKVTIYPMNVLAYEVCKDSSNKFTFSYKLKGKIEQEVFSAEDPYKIFKTLDAFVREAKTQGKEKASTKEHSLFSQVVGFIGS